MLLTIDTSARTVKIEGYGNVIDFADIINGLARSFGTYKITEVKIVDPTVPKMDLNALRKNGIIGAPTGVNGPEESFNPHTDLPVTFPL